MVMLKKEINNQFEAKLAGICIVATLLIVGGLLGSLARDVYKAYQHGNTGYMFEAALFVLGMVFVTYGNLL